MLEMTYMNKTITKHVRGNWFARLRVNGKWIYLYGRTQLDVCAKLKLFGEKIKQVAADKKFSRMIEGLITPAGNSISGSGSARYQARKEGLHPAGMVRRVAERLQNRVRQGDYNRRVQKDFQAVKRPLRHQDDRHNKSDVVQSVKRSDG